MASLLVWLCLDNTTLGGLGSCGYPSLKTVRSIDTAHTLEKNPLLHQQYFLPQVGVNPRASIGSPECVAASMTP